ncbi:MAG: hypothetical protein EOO90_21685 [Pedobacter sp.]|nr:MAG: hypothetical protein EOO90_21685 [Pedobacter sp.]
MGKLSLSQKSCEQLDGVLNAFGNGVHLDKSKVLELFENDENEASKHINILAQFGYIHKMAEVEGQKLGELFYKEDRTDLFLMEGGFTAQYLKALEEKSSNESRQNLLDENTKLQNDALKHQATIREQEERIRTLDEQIKRFEMLKNYEWLIRLAIIVTTSAIVWWFTQ